MLPFLKKAALLVVPLSIGLLLLSPYLYARLPLLKLGRQAPKVHAIMEAKEDAAIAIFGSSVAYVHFNPDIISEETGREAYNFGLDGTPLVQYKGVLKEFLGYSESEVVVIAGSTGEFLPRDLIMEFDNYRPYLENGNIYEALFAIDPDLVWKNRHLPLYDYVYYSDEYRGILKGDLSVPNIWEETTKGFHPIDRGWSPREVVTPDTAITIGIDAESVKSYREVIKLANAKGKKVVLVLAPIYQDAQEVMSNLEEFRALYRELAGEDNYFLDFTTHPISDDKSLFYNYTHLNAEGADLFSKAFAERLLELGVLK